MATIIMTPFWVFSLDLYLTQASHLVGLDLHGCEGCYRNSQQSFGCANGLEGVFCLALHTCQALVLVGELDLYAGMSIGF